MERVGGIFSHYVSVMCWCTRDYIAATSKCSDGEKCRQGPCDIFLTAVDAQAVTLSRPSRTAATIEALNFSILRYKDRMQD